MGLPDFLIIGAPKAGTTALHVALARHPELYLSAVKEPKYFLTDDVPPPTGGGPGDAKTYREQVWRRSDYEALFDGAPPGTLCGESTTLYLRDRSAHRRIHSLVPGARLVAVVRDPVDRAHSNWSHLRSAGLEPEDDFVRACALEPARAAKGWAPFWRYLEQGRYGEQLDHLYGLFPREQVLVLVYRDFRERPVETIDTVCRFLGVSTGAVGEVPSENVTAAPSSSLANRMLRAAIRRVHELEPHVPFGLTRFATAPATMLLQREQRPRGGPTPQEREALIPAFLDDIALVESLTGRSLAPWRDPRNDTDRGPSTGSGKFGTAYRSIDRPVMR